jgi:hypothetical protein
MTTPTLTRDDRIEPMIAQLDALRLGDLEAIDRLGDLCSRLPWESAADPEPGMPSQAVVLADLIDQANAIQEQLAMDTYGLHELHVERHNTRPTWAGIEQLLEELRGDLDAVAACIVRMPDEENRRAFVARLGLVGHYAPLCMAGA